MRKNLFGTEIFEKFDEFVTKSKLVQEQKSIEKKLGLISENKEIEENKISFPFFDMDGDKVYQVPFEVNGDHDIYNLYKSNKDIENLIDNISHGEGIEFEDGSIHWASDLFDAIKYYDSLYKDDEDLDEAKTDKDVKIKDINNELPIGDLEFKPDLYSDEELDEVVAGPDTDCDGQKEPVFAAKGSVIMEDVYPSYEKEGNTIYKMPYDCDSLEDLMILADQHEDLNKFLKGKLGSEDFVETDNDNVYKGSEIFDYILNSTDKLDETLDNMRKEWEDDNHEDVDFDIENDDNGVNYGEPFPKTKSIEEDLSKKMDKTEAKEIAETVNELSVKQQSLNESFNRMKFLINLENYR